MANLPTRQNNPGDLKDPSTGTFRQFKNPQEGYAALLNDLQAKMTGTSTTGIGPHSTLADFAKVYAPPQDKNNTPKYIADLSNHLKVSPNVTLKELHPRIGEVAEAIAHNEGFQSNNGLGTFGQPLAAPVQQPAAGIPPMNMPIAQTPQPAVSQETPQPGGGFMSGLLGGVQSFGRSIASPLLGVTALPLQATIAGANKVFGTDIKDPYANGIDIPGLGKTDVTPLDLEKKAGDVAQVGGMLVPGAGVMGAIGSGALMGAGSAMSEGKDLAETAVRGVEGGAIGGLAAGATKLVGKGIEKVGGLLSGGEAEKAAQGVEDAYSNALNLNASERGFEKQSGRSLAKVLTKYQAPLGRYENGTLDASGAIPKLQEVLDPLNQQAQELLTKPQGVVKYINLPDILDEVTSRIQKISNVSQAEKNASMAEAAKLFKAEMAQYGTDVEPAIADQIKQGFWGSVFKRALTTVDKVKSDTTYLSGNTMKTAIEDAVAGTDAETSLKSINLQRQEIIDAIKRLSKLDGVRGVRGGRLGHMFGGITGAIAGAASGLGAPGAIAGDYFGNEASKFLTDPQNMILFATGKQKAAGLIPGYLGKTAKPIGNTIEKAGSLVKKGARGAGLISNVLTK